MTSRCAKRANDRGDLIKSKNFFFRTESSFTRDFFVIQRASFTNFQIFVGKILFEERRGGERFSMIYGEYTEISLNLVQSKILEINTTRERIRIPLLLLLRCSISTYLPIKLNTTGRGSDRDTRHYYFLFRNYRSKLSFICAKIYPRFS